MRAIMSARCLRAIGGSIGLTVSISACFVTSQATGEHPSWRKPITTPEHFGLHAERVRFRSADSTPLSALWIATDSTARGTVVLAHGAQANGSYMLGRAAFLVRGGFNALVLDLRDCGESGGSYTTPGYKEADDVLAGVSYLKGRGGAGPIILLGHSAGAVAVLHAGRTPDVAAVIAESPFVSYRDMMKRVEVYVRKDPKASRWAKVGLWASQRPGMMAFSEWVFRLQTGVSISPDVADASVAVKRLGAHPTLFLGGGLDAIAPAPGVEALFRATPGARNVLAILPAATHDEFNSSKADYERTVMAFLARAVP